jgi:hypothetical protein
LRRESLFSYTSPKRRTASFLVGMRLQVTDILLMPDACNLSSRAACE